MGDFQTLASRLKSLKGWLTSTINACDNVLAMPHSIASSSFLKARIQDSIVELDGRLLKINNCLEQLQALELEKPYDDDRKQREESYANSRDRAAKSHQDCLNKLFERLAELDTIAEENASSQPSSLNTSQEDAGSEGYLKVQDTLKPFLITKDSSFQQFQQWTKQLKAFYQASKLERLDIISQQAFFRKFVSPELISVLESQIGGTTPIFEDNNAPGTDSCVGLLESEFLLRYPLVARRFKFFSLAQAKNETFIEFLAKIKSHGTLASLETLGIEGLYVYKAIIGINDDYGELRKKILQLSEISIVEVERIARSYESAQSTIKAIEIENSLVRVVKSKNKKHIDRQTDTKDYNSGTVKGRTPGERLRLLKKEKWCLSCGRHPKDKLSNCWAKSALCFSCNEIGHLSYLCPEDTSGSSDCSDEESGEDENSGAQTRKAFTT